MTAYALQMLGLYAGLNILLNLILAYRVSSNRVRAKVMTGTGEDSGLYNASRAHITNVEYTPIGLIGLLVVAKTEGALKALQAQFAAHGRDGRLSRAYIAFVWGKPGTFRGTIDAPLGRSAQNRRKMAVRKDGREAITHFQVAESYGEPEALVSRLVCRLETGRTHQIRVHLTHKGHPLLGDPIYGGSHATRKVKLSPDAQACLAALGRQALHACELGFEHPVTGEQMLFESPLPADLAALEAALRQI